VFDEATMLRQFGGNRNLATKIIHSAMNNIPNYLDTLEQAIAPGDWKEAAAAAHKLTALTAQIGGIDLSHDFKALEVHLRNGGVTEHAKALALRRDYQLLADRLQRWLLQN
jgi:HPt (histidine-containing phosphotransfer) domain-containing protein